MTVQEKEWEEPKAEPKKQGQIVIHSKDGTSKTITLDEDKVREIRDKVMAIHKRGVAQRAARAVTADARKEKRKAQKAARKKNR